MEDGGREEERERGEKFPPVLGSSDSSQWSFIFYFYIFER